MFMMEIFINLYKFMSIIHDGWTDTGWLSKKISEGGGLELSIPPAIVVNYLGLIGKTINIVDSNINLNDLNGIYNPNNLIPNNNLNNNEKNLNLDNGVSMGIYNVINQLRERNKSE